MFVKSSVIRGRICSCGIQVASQDSIFVWFVHVPVWCIENFSPALLFFYSRENVLKTISLWDVSCEKVHERVSNVDQVIPPTTRLKMCFHLFSFCLLHLHHQVTYRHANMQLRPACHLSSRLSLVSRHTKGRRRDDAYIHLHGTSRLGQRSQPAPAAAAACDCIWPASLHPAPPLRLGIRRWLGHRLFR